MPTMTHTLERHLLRRSLDNQLNMELEPRRHGRHSLTAAANKENFGVHFVRNSFGNASVTALHDLSNGKSPVRPEPTIQNLRRRTIGGTALNSRRMQLNEVIATPMHPVISTGRFSDDFADADDMSPLSHLHFTRNAPREETLSSSRMGDITLDRMLDAIIESARKEVRQTCRKALLQQQLATAAMNVHFPRTESRFAREQTFLDDADESLHEMEVRTPTHLKRQRVVRRKKPTAERQKKEKHKDVEPVKQKQKFVSENGTIDIHEESLDVGKSDELLNSIIALASPTKSLLTQTQKFRKLDIMTDCLADAACLVGTDIPPRCSTPARLEEVQSIKRCLSYSSDSDVDVDDDVDFVSAKRSSVASSNVSSITGDYCSSGRTSRASQSSLNIFVSKGTLDMAVQIEGAQLNVHVQRCRDLQRSNGSTAVNAYVKVTLIRSNTATKLNDNHGFQRTAVHRHSSNPYFDHHFRFDLSSLSEQSNVAVDNLIDTQCGDRLQLAVWHRDRQLKRSEFLGCLSFPLKTIRNNLINGTYKLQTQACLNKPQPSVLIQQIQSFPIQTAPISTPVFAATTETTLTPINQQQHHQKSAIMATLQQQKSNDDDDDVISIDNMAKITNEQLQSQQQQPQPMVLSKKALHQRDADENLFLRFLELDPVVDSTTATTTITTNTTTTTTATTANVNASGSQVSQGGRRLSAAGKPIGRTPFTMTKRLTRTAERGFGFSIVWTHPPRVEKIEAGLSADRCGILPGDYVIFVDKHNVVTMPEADVLNLIRSQGPTLTLEIFRRSGCGGAANGGAGSVSACGSIVGQSTTGRSNATTLPMNGKTPMATTITATRPTTIATTSNTSNYASDIDLQSTATTVPLPIRRPMVANNIYNSVSATGTTTISSTGNIPATARPSTACSGTSSIEAAKRRLHLPQVTFSKESIVNITDNRKRFLLQLISREQNYISALHFGQQRFVQPLVERKDLISPNDHRTLFQNVDELLRISEDILEQLCNDDTEPQMNFLSRVYLSKTTAICAAYKKYCNGIKRADCVLVNKSRQAGSEFVAFITEPQVPRKRPDLTMFIHRPLQHFREILKLMQLLASNCHVDSEEYKNFFTVINELQAAYREITVTSGLMEPLGEGRPLLTLQDLESRMVFTKCKPFTLAVQGRQWIFGGDLSRVEGRSVKPYWTLLFSDIIVFAKVSRDRVLFITEEPIPIANIVDSCFYMRKKTAEFRITVDPNGRLAESPTGYCAPDLSRTPKKTARRKSLVLRAPSLELKAVWQNLLQRQIFLVNAALGQTPLSSPLDSPDVLNTLVPLSDIGMASTSISSMRLASMDSINFKQQHQQKQQNNRLSHASVQIEMLIDEKCRILNKTGTPKSSALHLANWMKGQLVKQQEQARLAATIRSPVQLTNEDEQLLSTDSEQDERITYWTRQQLEKRTKELNLAKESGGLSAKPNFGGKRLSGVDELSMTDAYSDGKSQMSQSHSTTSDSQITVRSSPIILDKLTVCRHCHKNCQQQNHENSIPQLHQTCTSNRGLLCNSLKVQHSQSSPHRCCKLNGNVSRTDSPTSISSSTITGEHSVHSSKLLVNGSSKRETADTESDVAQLITDELSQTQSEATDESIPPIVSSSSEFNEAKRRISDSISKLRNLEQHNEARTLQNKCNKIIMNGHCSSVYISTESSSNRNKPEPPPRKFKILPETVKPTKFESLQQQVKTTVTITETARLVRVETEHNTNKLQQSSIDLSQSPKSLKIQNNLPKAPHNAKFTACPCKCTPADFEHTTLSPDTLEQQTCKLIESPMQSPNMPSKFQQTRKEHEDVHRHCKCTCSRQNQNISANNKYEEDDDLSLMLIGLAQFAPAAKLFNMKSNATTSPIADAENSFVPTIAVVPATPEAILTKTQTNVWDNSASAGATINFIKQNSANSTTTMTTAAITNLHINNGPRQAVIENIPDDSCDDSPLDEDPPYRPMNNSLRRFGTMSSLEKLPSDEHCEDTEFDDLETELEQHERDVDVNLAASDELNATENDNDDDADDFDDDDDDELDDNARADRIEQQVISKSVSAEENVNPWSTATSAKMSFFEESRAFIDKYLGRWNQEQQNTPNMQQLQRNNSETDELMDECTSGATSGEEVWGTPTSGGDNDELHMVSSENTYSSPTKSSTSLNDEDDTELMMDELLMAPPMTASSIRGLLPRRRLEPLFEEETESDEEKTQLESEEIKKGETTTNGRFLEDSAGSSSDETANHSSEEEDHVMTAAERGLKQQRSLETDNDEDPLSVEERLQPNLQHNIFGPRPLIQPKANLNQLPVAVLKASSCEYLLEPIPSVKVLPANSNLTGTNAFTWSSTPAITTQTEMNKVSVDETNTDMMPTIIGSSMPMMMKTTAVRITKPTLTNPAPPLTTTITSNASDTTSSSNVSLVKTQSSHRTTVQRPAASFIPPPPPPRRLLLTQTNLTKSTVKELPPQEKSGAIADSGSSVAVDSSIAGVTANKDNSGTTNMKLQSMKVTASQMMKQQNLSANTTTVTKMSTTAMRTQSVMELEQVVYNIKNVLIKSTSATAAQQQAHQSKRSSSTIIETSLLGAIEKSPTLISSTTVSTREMKEKQSTKSATMSNTSTVRTTKKTETGETATAVPQDNKATTADSNVTPTRHGIGLSPRLEMRLALNRDILDDEDLICYDPGPDLTTILGHDLSTFQRLTGRDLLNRSAMNRIQPKEAVISFSQQRNSKMDTPTVHRRPRPIAPQPTSSSGVSGIGLPRVAGVPQHLQPNRNTWSSSASAVQSGDANASVGVSSRSYSFSSDESKLSDLEILARREKIYCMSQLKSGSQVQKQVKTAITAKEMKNTIYSEQHQLTRTTSTTTMGEVIATETGTATTDGGNRTHKIGRDENEIMEAGKANKLINFIKRRNSENPVSSNCSQSSLNESTASGTPTHRQQEDLSHARKDNDKPSLNRRLWKQITKRRRASSVSEIAAS